jgi:hypothetical protein
MHTMVVFAGWSRHEAVLGAWLADAVGHGKKVLVLRAPGEDASLLHRSLAAAGLDPSGVVGSGQVEVLDSTRWRAESGGRADRLYELYLDQVRRAGGRPRRGMLRPAASGCRGATRERARRSRGGQSTP